MSNTLTYVPVSNTRPFELGETVLICDRNGETIGEQKIVRIGKKTLRDRRVVQRRAILAFPFNQASTSIAAKR